MAERAGELDQTEALIGRLAAAATPVRVLAAPWRRAALWLAAAAVAGLVLSRFTDLAAMRVRLMATPDMWLSEAGAAATTVLAALAAFTGGVPGRSRFWPLLPLPALAVWIGASGFGCMRQWTIRGIVPEPPLHGLICLSFVLLVSLPLAAMLIVLLLRACPLRPVQTALLAGLASAGAACLLLSLIHPFDATAEDLGLHLVGIVAILAASRGAGRRLMAGAEGPRVPPPEQA